jgi:hydroxypyruvate isomerase
MPKFSANLGFMWPDRPLLERIAAAGRAGFKAIELHFPYETPPAQVKAAAAAAGVKLLGINTHPAETGMGLAAAPGREVEARALIDQAFDYAAAAGGTSVHVMAGKVAPEDKPQARRTFLDNLGHAIERAEQTGLVVLLEPINQRNMPGYFYSSVEEAAAIIAELGSARVRLMFDFYHVGIMQGDVLKRFERHQALIGHVQIAAVPSRAEPDEGELAYRFILDTIDRLGYDGWVGAEYRPRADTDAGLAWLRTLGFTLG